MKKIFLLIFVWYICWNISYVSAENCEQKSLFEKWECQVNTVCETYKVNTVSFNPEAYQSAEIYQERGWLNIHTFLISNSPLKPIQKAVWVYKDNMNNIYNCAMIQTQINTLNTTKDKLLKYDSSGEIKSRTEPKITQLLQRLNLQSQQFKCTSIDKNMIRKENILKEVTYETCKYDFYLEYLKEHYSDVKNVLWIGDNIDENKPFLIPQVVDTQANILNNIEQERIHAYKTFPVSFQAYWEYENNFILHFLLEIIRNDFIIFREKLHQALTPMNQLVYKISNVMKK